MTDPFFQEHGYDFDVVYSAVDEFCLFENFIRLKMVRNISPNRIRRLFDLYTTIRKEGRTVERGFTMWLHPLYDNVSRNTLLLDLHLLEDAGLLNKTYEYPNGDVFVAGEVSRYKNPNPTRG